MAREGVLHIEKSIRLQRFRVFAGPLFLGALLSISASSLVSCASAPNTSLALEWYELGNSWFDKGEWKRAGEAYAHAISLDPKLSAASFNMARALGEAGDYAGALRALDGLASKDPGNVRVITTRAYVLFKKGDRAAAMTAYDEALRLDPYAPDAVFNAALLRASAGEKEAAAVDLERLIAAKPDDIDALLLLGRIEYELERNDTAIAMHEKVRALNKADAAALERLGILYARVRRFSEAIDTLAAAAALDAKRSEAWFHLARIRLTVAEDEEGGIEALKKALDSGFSDRAAAAALLEEPVLPGRETIQELLKTKGLLEGERIREGGEVE